MCLIGLFMTLTIRILRVVEVVTQGVLQRNTHNQGIVISSIISHIGIQYIM